MLVFVCYPVMGERKTYRAAVTAMPVRLYLRVDLRLFYSTTLWIADCLYPGSRSGWFVPVTFPFLEIPLRVTRVLLFYAFCV